MKPRVSLPLSTTVLPFRFGLFGVGLIGIGLFGVGLIGVGLCGCGWAGSDTGLAADGAARGAEPAERALVVFAAASTANVLDDLIRQFSDQAGTLQQPIRFDTNYASSSTLAQQIENGAEADLFLSANREWAEYLLREGFGYDAADLLSNRLVVIVPAGSSAAVRTPNDLLDPTIQHVALADASAPAGKYARQALESLGLWTSLEAKVVSGADVRRALSYVETGSAEAGIVYATDAALSRHVEVVLRLSPNLTEPIRYTAVRLSRARERPAVDAFLQFLHGPEARETFETHGFTLIVEPEVIAP